MTGRVGPS